MFSTLYISWYIDIRVVHQFWLVRSFVPIYYILYNYILYISISLSLSLNISFSLYLSLYLNIDVYLCACLSVCVSEYLSHIIIILSVQKVLRSKKQNNIHNFIYYNLTRSRYMLTNLCIIISNFCISDMAFSFD